MPEEIIAQPEANLVMPENTETPVQTEAAPTIVQEVIPEKKPDLHKIKVLHEEKEVPYDELIALAQQGADYKRVKSQFEEANQEKQFVEKMAKNFGMSVEQYKRESEKAAEEAKRSELVSQGIPDELAKEIIESREFRKEAQTEKEKVAAKERRDREASEFLKEFPNVNAETIPKSVWDDVNAGIPLVHAYSRFDRTNLTLKMAELERKLSVNTQNETNAAASPGSTLGGGLASPDYYSEERVANMTTKEIADNYDKIYASRKHWK